MSLSMHSMSVPVFVRALTNMLAWLDKAEAYAESRSFEANNYLGLRLAPDMLPFSRQIQIASDGAKNGVSRIAGVEPPQWADDETTLDELRARIQKTVDYAESLPAASFEGAETREIRLPLGPDRFMDFVGEDFLRGFSLPNFLFHVSMTYALLRQAGVPLGKMDYLGGV